MNFYSISLEIPSIDWIYPIKIFSNTQNKEILYLISDSVDNILQNLNLICKNNTLGKKDMIVIEKRDYLNKLEDNERNNINVNDENWFIINFKNNFNKLNLNKKEVMNIIYKRLYPLKIENEDYSLEIVKEIIKENDYSYIYITPNNYNFSYNSKLKINNVDKLLNIKDKSININNKSLSKIEENSLLNKEKEEDELKNIEKKSVLIENKKFIFTKGYNNEKLEEVDPKVYKWYEEFKKMNEYLDFDKYILTSKFSISRISFCYGEKRKRLIEDLNCPSPIYLNKDDLNNIFLHSFEEKYKGLDICPKTGLLITLDKQIIESQKGALLEAFKKLSSSLFSFNKTFKFSLPVRIFEPKSISQRLPEWVGYIDYIKCEENDLIRIKNAIKFFVSGIHRSPNQKKPFNPYLGETFEGNIGNIYKVYSEHVIHEPPTTFFLIEGPDFTFTAKMEQTLNFGNTIKASYKGFMILDYKNNKRIIASFPILQINGLIFGSKSTQYSGSFNIIDITSNYRALISFGTKKKVDEINGFLIKGKNDNFNKKFTVNKSLQDLYSEDINNDMGKHISLDEFKHKKNDVLLNITGSIFNDIHFDNEKVWDRLEDLPLKYECNDDCLPSDSRFREDLIWLYYNNIPIADEWKIKLEERQRVDRYLRKGKFTPEKVIKDL